MKSESQPKRTLVSRQRGSAALLSKPATGNQEGTKRAKAESQVISALRSGFGARFDCPMVKPSRCSRQTDKLVQAPRLTTRPKPDRSTPPSIPNSTFLSSILILLSSHLYPSSYQIYLAAFSDRLRLLSSPINVHYRCYSAVHSSRPTHHPPLGCITKGSEPCISTIQGLPLLYPTLYQEATRQHRPSFLLRINSKSRISSHLRPSFMRQH